MAKAITINMNGPGNPDARRELIKTIFDEVNPDVVFCQELPGKFDDVIGKDWEYVNVVKEAGVLWNKNIFEGTKVGFRSSDTRMREIRDGLGEPAENLLSRASFVKLTEKGENGQSFIAVSYHGEHNKVKEQKRREIFKCLIKFVKKLSEEECDIPFLIGGDFNFDTSRFHSSDVICGRYEMTPRAGAKGKIPYKDTFFWSTGKEIEMWDLKPHPIEGNPLDHDPIKGVLKLEKLKPEENPVEDLTYGIGKLSLDRQHRKGSSKRVAK